MPVRAPSSVCPALHRFFQISLPKAFLLSAFKGQLGPYLDANPLGLLVVVGQNIVGRVQVRAGKQQTALVAALGKVCTTLAAASLWMWQSAMT